VRRALCLAAILCAAAVRPGLADDHGCRFDGNVLVHGRRDSGAVALTFDACPTRHVPPFDSRIVDELEDAHAPATFFVSGRWAEAHPDALRRLAADPRFEIALHGYRHAHMTGASEAAITAEIESGRAALRELGDTPQALFRPPYGETPRGMQQAARQSGVVPVLWDVAPGDPDPHETAARIEHDVLAHVAGGSIVVLHVNGRGVATAAALPAVLKGIEARGLRLATVSELVRGCDAAAAGAGSP
jgi:peptidoglycan/xylan/chitin deacetylase (PgdA/CDA1 family)